jgi:hypothetical protein
MMATAMGGGPMACRRDCVEVDNAGQGQSCDRLWCEVPWQYSPPTLAWNGDMHSDVVPLTTRFFAWRPTSPTSWYRVLWDVFPMVHIL